MGLFETVPPGWLLARAVNWLIGVGEDASNEEPDFLTDILPEPDERDLERDAWLREAWEATAAKRTAARLWAAYEQCWHEDEDYARGSLAAFDMWATKYAIWLRRTLTEPASPSEIAANFKTVCEVLGQKVGEKTGTFIIAMFTDAKLPTLVVSAICKRGVEIETGRIKPATFAKMIELARRRLATARLVRCELMLDKNSSLNALEAINAIMKAKERRIKGGSSSRRCRSSSLTSRRRWSRSGRGYWSRTPTQRSPRRSSRLGSAPGSTRTTRRNQALRGRRVEPRRPTRRSPQ